MGLFDLDLSENYHERYRDITPTKDERRTISNLYRLYIEAVKFSDTFDEETNERKKIRVSSLVVGRLIEYGETLVNSISDRFTEVLMWAAVHEKFQLSYHKTMADLRIKFATSLVKHYDSEMYSDIWFRSVCQTEDKGNSSDEENQVEI